MASDPGNSDDKPGKGGPDAPKPASAPAGSPAPSPARGPFLIVTPPIGQVLASQAPPPQPLPSETPPGQTPAAKVQPARPASANKPNPPEPVAPELPPAREEREEPILGEAPPDEPTYDEPTHHEPPRLVDPASPPPPPSQPQRPAGKPAPRPATSSLAARSADRLAELNGPPQRRGGGCLTLLLIIAILAGGGYFLWRAGKLDPLLSWAEPYTAPIVAKIEALIPGHQEEAAPASTSDDAMIIETKQLLQKLDFNPGPIDGTLDPATVAAIQAYQEAAGENVDGQPSQALLDELRSVANPPLN